MRGEVSSCLKAHSFVDLLNIKVSFRYFRYPVEISNGSLMLWREVKIEGIHLGVSDVSTYVVFKVMGLSQITQEVGK